MTTGLTLSARCMYALRTRGSKCRSRQRPLCSIPRDAQWLAISTYAHVASMLNKARHRDGPPYRPVFYDCTAIVLALLPSRYDNGIGAQRPNLRQCLFRRCIHRRCTGAAFPDSPCSRFTAVATVLSCPSPFPSPSRLTQLLDELNLSIERPSISIGTFSMSVTDACFSARDEQRAQRGDALSPFVSRRDPNSCGSKSSPGAGSGENVRHEDCKTIGRAGSCIAKSRRFRGRYSRYIGKNLKEKISGNSTLCISKEYEIFFPAAWRTPFFRDVNNRKVLQFFSSPEKKNLSSLVFLFSLFRVLRIIVRTCEVEIENLLPYVAVG